MKPLFLKSCAFHLFQINTILIDVVSLNSRLSSHENLSDFKQVQFITFYALLTLRYVWSWFLHHRMAPKVFVVTQ
jgi:hypothetical protein